MKAWLALSNVAPFSQKTRVSTFFLIPVPFWPTTARASHVSNLGPWFIIYINKDVDLAFLELLPEYLHFTFRMCNAFFLLNLKTLLTTNKHCLGFGRNHSRRTGYCAKSPGACPGPDFCDAKIRFVGKIKPKNPRKVGGSQAWSVFV